MKKFEKPRRVWINCPSTLQPYHEFHGKVGIAHTRFNSLGNEETVIYFTQGSLLSMIIDPLYLETKNSQNNILQYGILENDDIKR
jgi:hypothetical protein